jgi:hypothetical protein
MCWPKTVVNDDDDDDNYDDENEVLCQDFDTT